MVYEIQYESTAMNNFLVVKPSNTNVIDYCATMMENNQIDGLLPLHRQNIEGEVRLYYNITGKKKLSDLLKRQSLNHEQCKKMILNIFSIFENLERYFLGVKYCELSLDNIYTDNGLDLYFILMPVEQEHVDENIVLHNFFKELIGQNMLRYPNSNMQKYANYFFAPAFNIVEFMELFKDEIKTEKNEVKIQKKPQINESVHISKSVIKPVEVVSQEKREDVVIKEKPTEQKSSENANKFNFAIPGGGTEKPSIDNKKNKKKDKPVKVKKEDKKDVKEKKSLFGKLLKKADNSKNIQPVNIPNSSQQVQASPVQHSKPIMSAKEVYESTQDDSWKGTDIYGNDGATAFYDDNSQVNSVFLIHNGKAINVNKNKFTIGRRDADYVINSTVVSGLHATVMVDETSSHIIDENSKNGTIINGNRIAPYSKVELKDGDIIQIGKDDLIVKIGM